jgi:uncharacterized membrane protein
MAWLSSIILYPAIMLALLVLVFFLFFQLYQMKKQVMLLSMQSNASELIISDMQILQSTIEKQLETIEKDLHEKYMEDVQVSKQIEHRIKTLQNKVLAMNDSIAVLNEQQPQDKLYSRASKLAVLGADVEEIMRECELPRAEVEMLLSVYNKKA